MADDKTKPKTKPKAVPAVQATGLNLWYGTFQALYDVDMALPSGVITGMIGPSGCGKSTLLRCVTRIVERAGYVRSTGSLAVMGQDIYADNVELVQLRKRVGMVFQRPNPLPVSIRKNVMFGHAIHTPASEKRSRDDEEELLVNALQTVLLWDKVKDRLDDRATSLSLEEQQKLCIARLLPVKPSILLMDEPCSALDPNGTAAVEELIWTLRGEYTILIVTHNMAQARRATEECVFMLNGKIVEHSETGRMFVAPASQETADYIEGRYG